MLLNIIMIILLLKSYNKHMLKSELLVFFAAYLYDITGDINMPFYVGSTMQILAVGSYILTMYINNDKGKEKIEMDMDVTDQAISKVKDEAIFPSSPSLCDKSIMGSNGYLGSMKGSISYIGSVKSSVYHLGSIKGSVSHIESVQGGSVSHLGSVRSIRHSTSNRGSTILLPTPVFGSMISISSTR